MSQKWANLSNNMLEDYHLHSESPSQMQNMTVNSSQPSSIENQKSRSEHIMISSEHFIDSSDSTKKLCMSTAECNISENTCREILEAEQTTDGECQNFKEKYLQNSCFVCSCQIDENDFVSVKESSKYSHAPLVVLLMDVLGYRLEMENLHSKTVCGSCFKLIDTIDKLQQTLTESKTDLRRKFLDTFQKLKLKYPRTDKMLKSPCLKCVQINHHNSRKKRKGGRIIKEKNNFEIKNAKHKVNLHEESLSEEEIIQKDRGELVHVDQELNYNSFKNCESSENLFCLQENDFTSIYDTDPMFFSPDEKLKAGYMKSSNGSQVIFCFYCTAQYDSSLSLKMHVRIFHMPVIIYDNGQGTTGSRYRIGIKLQNISHNEKFGIESPYSCLFCLASYKLEGSLQFHFKEKHSTQKPYQCLECKEQFRKSIELSRHKVYNCSIKIQNFENKG
ncbi:Myoneurin [Armadillidium vulgare]|nr:Myoneurin [Armadillidium vulgare]